jgi:hypothetical protein
MQAAAAVLVVFALISLGLATDAGRWNFLVRIFQPVMEETLGIHLNAGDSQSAGRVEKETSFPDDMSESVIIREEGKVPKAIKGYAAVPAWLPDGFAFEYAEVFEDSFESSQTVAYRKADLELFAQTVVYKDAETAVNVVEKNARDDARNAREIAFTENEGVVSATCEDNLACYMVWGRLSREDISSVITSLIKGAG